MRLLRNSPAPRRAVAIKRPRPDIGGFPIVRRTHSSLCGLLAIASGLWFAALSFAQPAAPQADAQRIDITVERNEAGAWKALPPGFVFTKGDHLRFRVRANFDGFLYVMNYGTSGQYANLFPRRETGTDNRIKSGVEYNIPATEASFRIDGPPGFDTVYWVMSPLELGNTSSGYIPLPPPPANPAPQNMKPRCDDTILHARGLCIDSSAGPKSITPNEKLPENLSAIPRAQSRDIVIFNQTQGTSISTPEQMKGPILYKFLVAHQ
jgi:hypothetical protein